MRVNVILVNCSVPVRRKLHRVLNKIPYRNFVDSRAMFSSIETSTYLRNHATDMIVIDLSHNPADNVRLLENLKHINRLKHIPVLMVTDKHHKNAECYAELYDAIDITDGKAVSRVFAETLDHLKGLIVQ